MNKTVNGEYETLHGRVEHVTYKNQQTGYTVFKLAITGETVVVTGNFPYVSQGDVLNLTGEYVVHNTYGPQFKAYTCEKEAPTDEAAILRYLSCGAIKGIGPATAGKIIKRFGNSALDVVALNTTNASSSAIFTVDGDAHTYFYFANNTLYKAGQPDANGAVEKIALAYNVSGGTLWTIDGDYLYYYGTGTNGNNISRINYTGDAEDYNPLLVEEEYEPLTIAYVDWNSSWYNLLCGFDAFE